MVDVDGTTLLALAAELVERGELDAAIELGEITLRDAARQFDARGEFDAGMALDLLLLLLRESALDPARRLGALAEDWLYTRRHGDSEGNGEKWIYTWELLALPHGFSARLRRALAEALLSRQDGSIAKAFKRHRFRADASASLLRDYAPLLYDAYWEFVDHDEDFFQYAQLGLWGLAILIVLVRCAVT